MLAGLRARLRSGLLLGFAALAAMSFSALDCAAADVGDTLIVSRARVFSETRAARQLRAAEAGIRTDLKQWIAAQKKALAERELELSSLRQDTPRAEFELLTDQFDLEVRRIRRETQGRESAIQVALREARNEMLKALYPVLIEVLRRHQAEIILDAEHILIADPRTDVTDEVIALYDERAAIPKLPEFDELPISPVVPKPGVLENTPPASPPALEPETGAEAEPVSPLTGSE